MELDSWQETAIMLCIQSEFLEFFDESVHCVQTAHEWHMLALSISHLLVWPSDITRSVN